ncbi:MAG: entericidin A/B family lipoprotein [Acetobacteraceae bacterium]|nr:entericidin A/B family lipoprotein [Acetobacteraceae bacterium]MBV8521045.1 entericidin A/B family lipoprotein [Acetobacteraceae bacterium]MBV8589926.1 entericidin A/B family lipoprotein [Acetobacteraceae bacterium]
MRKVIIGLLLLGLTAPMLMACHTVAGAGEDVSKAGQAVQKGANTLTPRSP